MTRVGLGVALRAYYRERGMTPEESELEAKRVHARVVEMCKGKGSADIHLDGFYFAALEEDGEFFVDGSLFDGGLENLRRR